VALVTRPAIPATTMLNSEKITQIAKEEVTDEAE
jgi:hypothetical protein